MGDNMDKKVNDFVIFCLEIYRSRKELTGKEVYELFEKYNVFEYLRNGYEMLHTQGDKWLLEDIDNFLEIRGYKCN